MCKDKQMPSVYVDATSVLAASLPLYCFNLQLLLLLWSVKYLPIYLSVYLSISISLSLCLSVCLSIDIRC